MKHRSKEREGSYTIQEEPLNNQQQPEPKTSEENLLQNFRGYLTNLRDRGTPYLLKLQKIRNPVFDAYFRFADFCGEELSLLCLLPFNAWATERLGLHGAVLISAVGFGNYLKNIFYIDRPHHPQLWHPDGKQKADHGFPSTHSINAISMFFYFFVYLYVDQAAHVNSYILSTATAFILFSSFVLSIIFSRLYLGYHSLLDVFTGSALGVFLLIWFHQSLRYYLDAWVVTGIPGAISLTFLAGYFCMRFHPQPPVYSPASAETGITFGSSVGTTMGYLVKTHTAYVSYIGDIRTIDPDSTLGLIRSNLFYFILARFIVGMIVVAIVRSISKMLLFRTFRKIYGDKIPPDQLALIKFYNYVAISFTVIIISPTFFRWVGLNAVHDLRPYTATSF